MAIDINSLKWNKDKHSMNVSKSYLKKLRQFIRLLLSPNFRDKSKCSKIALEIFHESKEKGENRRLAYFLLKKYGIWLELKKMVRLESGNQWIIR